MAKEIPIQNKKLSDFISDIEEQGKIQNYLRKKFSISDDDIEDAFYGSLKDIIEKDRAGKLSEITCSFTTFFTKVCINQTLKLIRKKEKTVPFFDDRKISNTNAVRDDKVDALYGFCMDTEEEDRKVRLELLVNNIIASMTDTCKNILHSYYWDDFSTSTIADMFNFSNADSVKTQKYKCMNKFRDKYNELKGKIYG